MISYLLSRLGLVLVTAFGVTVLAFVLIHALPGDPIELMFGERGIDPEKHAMLMAQLGLDRPLPRAIPRLYRPRPARRPRPIARHP